MIAGTHAAYLLLEDGAVPDELEALAARHPTVATAPGLRLVALGSR